MTNRQTKTDRERGLDKLGWTKRKRVEHIEGSRPDWCTFTIYHAWDTPFWSGTLDIWELENKNGKVRPRSCHWLDIKSSLSVLLQPLFIISEGKDKAQESIFFCVLSLICRGSSTQVIAIIIIALKGAMRLFTIRSLCRKLSPSRTLKWPGHNRVQITCNTLSAYHMQPALYDLVRKDSSAIKSDRVEITFIWDFYTGWNH